MLDTSTPATAITAPARYADLGDRTIAYRSIGAGRPLLLCMRFRGTMDLWDPAFLDALCANGFQVIVFDYTGLGLSTGTPSYNPLDMANDPLDLIAALDLDNVVLGGWSLGGFAVLVVLAKHPEAISHLLLIGTGPAGTHEHPGEQLFYDLAGIEVYDLEDETALFFEPASEASREAAKRSVARIASRAEVHTSDHARRSEGVRRARAAFPQPRT